ncbi:MAG: hypothetical protein IIX17_03255 [Tidjanibacter sp.]|nr:hypothetical protein [Tidjanibacter sp.]
MAKGKIYTMSPGKADQLVSWSACLILIAVAVLCFVMESEEWLATVLVGVIGIVTAAYTFAMSPQCIIVDGEGVGIRQRMGGKFLPLREIKSVEWYDKSGKTLRLDKTTIRVAGNGGMFGYTGRWRNKEIGTFTIYARRLTGLVLIEMADGKKIVVSCDEPQALVDDLTSRIGLTSKL